MTERLEEIRRQITPILQARGVKRAGVFGSIARGDDHLASDLDLLVEFESRASLLDLVGLGQELEDLLGFSVDVVTYSSIHPELRDDVLQEEVGIL